eukprot:2033341-Pleurochrysis_carterae.AAC.5
MRSVSSHALLASAAARAAACAAAFAAACVHSQRVHATPQCALLQIRVSQVGTRVDNCDDDIWAADADVPGGLHVERGVMPLLSEERVVWPEALPHCRHPRNCCDRRVQNLHSRFTRICRRLTDVPHVQAVLTPPRLEAASGAKERLAIDHTGR